MRLIEEKINFEKGFGSASGILYTKDIFFLEMDTLIFGSNKWEITYSPSMGATKEEIKQDIVKYIQQNNVEMLSTNVVKNHISWIDFISQKKSSFISKKLTYRGVEHGLTTSCSSLPEWADFLRVKAKVNFPEWILNLNDEPKVLVIDYNSSGNETSILEDVTKLKEAFPNSQIYLEQPYSDMTKIDRKLDVKYIFDTSNTVNLIQDKVILPCDIILLKIGRNSPKEYLNAINKGIWVGFGNVSSSKRGQEVCSEIAEQLSTIIFTVETD
ncbi:hypothetical protein [Bacillus cytotoxicus]|uniref:hypothetical protein n=1 Tax=Bacillus cytotoxicus TaxID=580165 RepID=UPI00086416D8|nr:hypothetical protein [Bacillus cytotoxicus]AWC27165.1 hypothetical protein CG483_001125 [Bacillus cytotoxicus]AWC39279.1 hypothetical protein CG480_001125 [Bacillus cytotoxicus]AWC47210.1 hypothetical protein CG478_001125 [Bacillus cytotoxicus]AWC51231.1 hypothetical protein CG477_001125 [Bacillus cytotoxicus]AWC55360.1 hypothetical protein CG476_001125 [Bacillus cytotoxicus]